MTRAAYLRELFGDVDGASINGHGIPVHATDWDQDRADSHPNGPPPDHLRQDRWSRETVTAALALFPAITTRWETWPRFIQQKRYDQAVDLLQQRYKAAPHAENLYDLAEALEWAGRPDAAAKAFAEFETKSLLESVRADNSNRELIFYYADHANQPAKALEVAKREVARRHDVYTLDSYAWALHVNGQYEEARKQIETALAVGIRDAKLFRHAGEIALECGDRESAERYLQDSAAMNASGSRKPG